MRQSRWKVAAYAIIVLCGILAVIPNFLNPQQLDRLPDWLPKRQLTLGLDLRGGSQLLLEIDTEAVLRDRLTALASEADSTLREARIAARPAKVLGSAVTVELADASKAR